MALADSPLDGGAAPRAGFAACWLDGGACAMACAACCCLWAMTAWISARWRASSAAWAADMPEEGPPPPSGCEP